MLSQSSTVMVQAMSPIQPSWEHTTGHGLTSKVRTHKPTSMASTVPQAKSHDSWVADRCEQTACLEHSCKAEQLEQDAHAWMTERVRMMTESGSRSSVNGWPVIQPTRHTTGMANIAICAGQTSVGQRQSNSHYPSQLDPGCGTRV